MKSARLHLILPAANVIIAIAALGLRGDFGTGTGHGWYEWYAPVITFCCAANAPAITIADALSEVMKKAFDLWPLFEGYRGVFLLSVWTQWYVVARTIWPDKRVQKGESLQAKGLRITRDICLVCFGIAVALDGLNTYRLLGGDHYMRGLRAASLAASYFAWAAVIVLFYGRALERRVTNHLSS